MRQNPCRYCVLAFVHNGIHSPSVFGDCDKCENLKEHQKFLESKRKFTVGEPITTINELLEQEFVMWNGRTKHIETFKSMPLRVVLQFLKWGSFKKAVRKSESEVG